LDYQQSHISNNGPTIRDLSYLPWTNEKMHYFQIKEGLVIKEEDKLEREGRE